MELRVWSSQVLFPESRRVSGGVFCLPAGQWLCFLNPGGSAAAFPESRRVSGGVSCLPAGERRRFLTRGASVAALLVFCHAIGGTKQTPEHARDFVGAREELGECGVVEAALATEQTPAQSSHRSTSRCTSLHRKARISVGQLPAPAPSPADVPSRFFAPSS